MTSRIQLRSVMRKRMGVGDYRFGASLHREIAQPLGVPFAGFRMTNDGSRDCLARGVINAPVMQGLDSELECEAQETCCLWIEPLPIEVLSDRHCRNTSARVATLI
jgi:hypothetical protein